MKTMKGIAAVLVAVSACGYGPPVSTASHPQRQGDMQAFLETKHGCSNGELGLPFAEGDLYHVQARSPEEAIERFLVDARDHLGYYDDERRVRHTPIVRREGTHPPVPYARTQHLTKPAWVLSAGGEITDAPREWSPSLMVINKNFIAYCLRPVDWYR